MWYDKDYRGQHLGLERRKEWKFIVYSYEDKRFEIWWIDRCIKLYLKKLV